VGEGGSLRTRQSSPSSIREEGRKLVGESGVSDPDRDGIVPFTFKPQTKVQAGMFVTAAATSVSAGDTSEFSAAKKMR
jgi:hypothetical protein